MLLTFSEGRVELTLDDLINALEAYRAPAEIGRHELTNEQWCRIRHLFPRPTTLRGRPRPSRRLLDGMFWILRTGAPWRDLPERYGPWKTVWRRFHEWRRSGRLLAVKAALLGELNDRGKLDWDLWCVDGTSVRASRSATGARKGGPWPRASRRIMRSEGHGEDSGPRSTS